MMFVTSVYLATPTTNKSQTQDHEHLDSAEKVGIFAKTNGYGTFPQPKIPVKQRKTEIINYEGTDATIIAGFAAQL